MSKSVEIELLESNLNTPRYGMGSSGNILHNSGFSSNTDWLLNVQSGSCTQLWSITGGHIKKTSTANCSYFEQPVSLTEGHRYMVQVRFKNYNRVGSLLLANHVGTGGNHTVFNSTIVPSGSAGTGSSYRTLQSFWVQGSNNTNRVRFYMHAGGTVDIDYIQVYKVGSAEENIHGRLDATTTDTFPLALTFSVNDPTQIDARKGAYSKTFEIPATENNNRVLKHFAIPNSTNLGASIFNKISCRIIIGGLFSIRGLLQVKENTRIDDMPLSYSCVFFGDNLEWSTSIGTKYLSDLQLENSTDLEVSAKNIITSWNQDNATETTDVLTGTQSTNTSPVVYPISTYGYTNQNSTFIRTLALNRTQEEVDYLKNGTALSGKKSVMGSPNHSKNYKNADPTSDWRPMVWVYNMIHQIFADAGYKIESNFIESDNFRKLLYASPNFTYNDPNIRYTNFSFLGNFKNSTKTNCSAVTNSTLTFHNEEHSIFRTWMSAGAGPKSWAPDGDREAININNDSVLNMPWAVTRLKFDNATCNAYQNNVGGSGRFQPATGEIVNSSPILQQSTLISTAGFGTSNDPKYSVFTIGESGYYTCSTKNIMYYYNFNSGFWTGTGTSTASSVLKLYGGLTWQVKRTGTTINEWKGFGEGEGAEDEFGNVIPEQELTPTSGIRRNQTSYSFGGTLQEHQVQGYLQKGDQLRVCFMYWNPRRRADQTGSNVTEGSHMIQYGATTGQTTTITYNLELIGGRYNNFGNGNGSVSIELTNPDEVEYMSTYDLQDILPNDQKQLDFIKGLAHSFNLQFSTDTASKTVFIEPYNDFYLPPSQAIDWTEKLDRSKEMVTSFIETNLTRRLVFKYKEDSKDRRIKWMGENYFENIPDMYPEIIDLGDSFPVGETVFENPFFSSSYESQNPYIVSEEPYTDRSSDPSRNFYSAALWEKLYPVKADAKGKEFQPRLLYYNKVQNLSSSSSHTSPPYNWGFSSVYDSKLDVLPANSAANVLVPDVTFFTSNFQGVRYGHGTGGWTGNICSAVFVNRHEFTNQFGLCYGDYWAKDYDPATNSYNAVGDQVGHGLYSRYYASMISDLAANPKKITGYFDLKLKDITELNFRKLAYIDGVYYRIIKVVDYKPHLNETTKVELQQVSFGEGERAPNIVFISENSSGSGSNTGGGSYDNDGGSTDVPIDFD